MIPTSQDFYARVLAYADDARRLPVPDQAGWEIFPFGATRCASRCWTR